MSDTITIGQVKWSGGRVTCGSCGEELCAESENWKDHALARRGLASERLNGGEFGRTFLVHENPNVELAELFCGNCYALLSVELYTKGEPYRWTFLPAGAAHEQGYDPKAEFESDPGEWLTFD